MTDNIRKLIANCSTVTHGGVPATTEHTRLAKVAAFLLTEIEFTLDVNEGFDDSVGFSLYEHIEATDARLRKTLQEAEGIAGDV